MGNEKEFSGSHRRRYGSQLISVPFLWEQKPGMPKRDWNPKPVSLVAAGISAAKRASSAVTATLPLKFVISVPFKWEEKPGKPLLLDANPFMINEEEGNVFDPFAFVMHSSSFPSDLSNNALAAPQGASSKADSNQSESWYSISEMDSDSDSSGSAMTNGGIDLGNSSLDLLSPLPCPDAGFLRRIYGLDSANLPVFAELGVKNCTHDCSHAVKRTPTLGELILLSQKPGCRRKSAIVKKYRLFSKEFTWKGLFACFTFG